MPPSYKTIASFCEYTAEMIEGVSDSAELIKRHRASLERLRDGMLATIAFDILRQRDGHCPA